MSSTCAAPVALIVKLCLDHTEETTPAYKGVLLWFYNMRKLKFYILHPRMETFSC